MAAPLRFVAAPLHIFDDFGRLCEKVEIHRGAI